MKHLFKDIRPYSENETMVEIKKMFTDPNFIKHLAIFEDKIDVKQWVVDILACKTRLEFHLTFADRVFHYFINKTCAQIHFAGIENIDIKNQYLFIGNHRDIILDSSYLQIYYFKNGCEATLSAIGDNLISTPFFYELARLHKMFLVFRSGSLKETIYNTRLLSSFIYHSIFEEKESVWIAQGNGRTKNGNDKTQQGLLKMLTLSSSKDAMQILRKMQITPVTISYQYEPCAQLKARELALSENCPYIKKSGEDAKSIIEGVTGYKGDVHLVIGKPLKNEFDDINPELSLNEKLAMLCSQIDQQIYKNYFLFPQNYIAFDILENSDRFSSQYTHDEKAAFYNYLNEKSVIQDVSKEKMVKYLLNIYANPVKNRFNILDFCGV